MQTIYVSADFPLNRRMRKAVQRGKLHVVRDGGERSGLGGGNGGNDNGSSWEDSVLSVTPHGNAIDYLKMAVRSLAELRDNPYAWKWILISLHGAIYGFAVCAASDSVGMNVLRGDKLGDKFLCAYLRGGGKNILRDGKLGGNLLSFGDVIKICQNEKWMRRLVCSQPLVLSEEQNRSLEKLRDLRNRMAHFPPKCHREWSLSRKLVTDCLEVVQQIALGTKLVDWRSRDEIGALCAKGIELAHSHIPADGE